MSSAPQSPSSLHARRIYSKQQGTGKFSLRNRLSLSWLPFTAHKRVNNKTNPFLLATSSGYCVTECHSICDSWCITRTGRRVIVCDFTPCPRDCWSYCGTIGWWLQTAPQMRSLHQSCGEHIYIPSLT